MILAFLPAIAAEYENCVLCYQCGSSSAFPFYAGKLVTDSVWEYASDCQAPLTKRDDYPSVCCPHQTAASVNKAPAKVDAVKRLADMKTWEENGTVQMPYAKPLTNGSESSIEMPISEVANTKTSKGVKLPGNLTDAVRAPYVKNVTDGFESSSKTPIPEFAATKAPKGMEHPANSSFVPTRCVACYTCGGGYTYHLATLMPATWMEYGSNCAGQSMAEAHDNVYICCTPSSNSEAQLVIV